MDVEKNWSRTSEEQTYNQSSQQKYVAQPKDLAPDTNFNEGAQVSLVLLRETLVSKHRYARANDQDQNHQKSNDENQECVVVVNSNAIVDPRAVVVKSFNTPVTDSAVFASRSA